MPSEGLDDGLSDGVPWLGEPDGEALGLSDGVSEGVPKLGDPDGEPDGEADGVSDGVPWLGEPEAVPSEGDPLGLGNLLTPSISSCERAKSFWYTVPPGTTLQRTMKSVFVKLEQSNGPIFCHAEVDQPAAS